MLNTRVQTYISYSTFAVYDAALTKPYNDWTEAHVLQGFSWREGSVSFATIHNSGTCSIELITSENYQINNQSQRSIYVPFRCPENGDIEIGGISHGTPLKCPVQTSGILFDHGIVAKKDQSMWCRLTFVTGRQRPAEILLADNDITRPKQFSMTATPA